MRVYNSIEELIGNTPILRLNNIERELSSAARLYAKLEYFNPAGSAKDRIAAAMIADAEEKGLLKKGSVIIEPTSGNTGIGLAAVAASKGYKVILTMPETMSIERQKLLAAYGATVVLTDGKKGMSGAIEKANELARDTENSFIPAQFENPANPAAHEKTTGKEIWNDLDGDVDIFVAGVGTGGTISGVGRFLKSKNNGIKIVAAEPDTSAVLSGEPAGAHGIQGIGAGFIPKTTDISVIDEVIKVPLDGAYRFGRLIVQCEGILVGISSGAALWAAAELARREENKGKSIVALLPDTGERYLSTAMFE